MWQELVCEKGERARVEGEEVGRRQVTRGHCKDAGLQAKRSGKPLKDCEEACLPGSI